MRSALTTVRRFLTAEEVPRWFGLSIVLIYLVGLGSVAQFGITQARKESAAYYQRSGRYATGLLAKRLAVLRDNAPPQRDPGDVFAQALREFATFMPVRSLRVVSDAGQVVASCDLAHRSAVGAVSSAGPPGAGAIEPTNVATAGTPTPGIFLRFPVLSSNVGPEREKVQGADAPVAATAASRPVLYLEARFPPEPPRLARFADRARMLAAVLVVLGALFVVYHCLREQLRGMSRIADRLQAYRDRLEEELDSLRVCDTLDSVTTAWNELVDLTRRSIDSVHRSEADQELSRALQSSGGGALAGAFNAIPDGILLVTAEGRVEHANAAACHLFGWSQDDARQADVQTASASGVGADVLDLLRDAQRPDGGFEPRNTILEVDEGTKDTQSCYRVCVIPMDRAQQCAQCVVLIRDVSQQIRAERAREEFITQVTHELRTPLTNIRAYAETLSSGTFDDPKIIGECYNVITKETRRLSRLVEDMLSVSQLEVGTIELALDSVNLDTLLGDGVRDVRALADEKSIDLQLVLPSKLEPIRADRDKLAVVINNLLGNAIKYTLSGGSVVVGCQITADQVVITVKDNGVGIDPADHARVFEKFQRANDPAIKDAPGSGIGLYTAREIVRRHHGEIELISDKGKGSTFLVRLPHQGTRAVVLSTAEEA